MTRRLVAVVAGFATACASDAQAARTVSATIPDPPAAEGRRGHILRCVARPREGTLMHIGPEPVSVTWSAVAIVVGLALIVLLWWRRRR